MVPVLPQPSGCTKPSTGPTWPSFSYSRGYTDYICSNVTALASQEIASPISQSQPISPTLSVFSCDPKKSERSVLHASSSNITAALTSRESPLPISQSQPPSPMLSASSCDFSVRADQSLPISIGVAGTCVSTVHAAYTTNSTSASPSTQLFTTRKNKTTVTPNSTISVQGLLGSLLHVSDLCVNLNKFLS